MRSISISKKEGQLKNILSIIIEELDDKDIVLPTIVDVRLSNDTSHARIFVSFYKQKNRGLSKLIGATNYIKKQLAAYLDWRKIPNLVFELDHLTDDGMRIDKILEDLKKEA
ncbi:Ribosome-binding factor A [Mycoplasmopsis californica]|uniref:Ribosome-binding factor A n=1 Tax=Mycoplasmopsis equigenitalium TaxID=114883 RepID=A0ABY5J0V4_9BACT|nr:30S ribosome-binding factor RbfA [Mycoplasmopsis equigenitalium]UUD36883.1 30S ribosome-binding factor RbfA [Mycoplasmopsis equigenitalium]VEU69822.1 Ribosome-binding factor A [Mycoplasmopsis californica]